VLVQAAEWLGSEGLSLAVVSVDALVAQAVWAALHRRPAASVARPAIAAAGAVMLLAGSGWMRLREEDRHRASAARQAVSVAAVQLAVPQSERWRPEAAWGRIDALLDETRRAARAGARLVVWPETAIEVHLDEAAALGGAVAEVLADRPDTLILAGAPRAVRTRAGTRYYNSAVLLDTGGGRLGLYDKVLLYPGSEYVPPWVLALPGARRVLASQLRWAPYSPGSVEEPLRADGWTLGVLICAEGVVPEPARRRVRAGATLLVHLANDAVIDAPAAIAQHFAIARLRAVETRRPLVRASNRGVSAVVAASGRVLARAAPERPGVAIASVVPRSDVTWATRTAWLWPWACVTVVLVAGLVPERRRRADGGAS
jgi:apolipoprotein N-acyltransferase